MNYIDVVLVLKNSDKQIYQIVSVSYNGIRYKRFDKNECQIKADFNLSPGETTTVSIYVDIDGVLRWMVYK